MLKTVTQEDSRGTSFTCTCSFKRHTPSGQEQPNFQDDIDLQTSYSSVLKGKRPEQHPDFLNTEVPPLVAG